MAEQPTSITISLEGQVGKLISVRNDLMDVSERLKSAGLDRLNSQHIEEVVIEIGDAIGELLWDQIKNEQRIGEATPVTERTD